MVRPGGLEHTDASCNATPRRPIPGSAVRRRPEPDGARRAARVETELPHDESEFSLLSLVLPKGSLERATLDLFDAADLTVQRSSDRDYHAAIDDPRIDRVKFLRPQEIPSYVAEGLFDFGITGRDWITETGANVTSLGELQYSKATSSPVRVVLAVPASVSWQSVSDLPDGLRISTEFPELTRRFLDSAGAKAAVTPSYGAPGAKVPDSAAGTSALTEPGSSFPGKGWPILRRC